MFLGRVMGRVVTSVADPGMHGLPLLIVQPLDPALNPKGAPIIVTDRVGVGTGEIVSCETSREAGLGLPNPLTPTDASIVARVDEVHIPAARADKR